MDKIRLPASLQSIALPDWVHWLAQDRDGCWWAYEVEPHQSDTGWYENEVGRILKLGMATSPADWRKCLLRVK